MREIAAELPTGADRPGMIVGVSGASGAVIALELLRRLGALGIVRSLVVSKSGALTANYELEGGVAALRAEADHVHPIGDIGARIASGSSKTLGMAVAPCSTRTLAAIATGVSDNLLTRAADVTLKERRRLVLAVRETPLHLGHLENMVRASRIGAVIMPPMPAFYAKPESVDDLVEQFVGRLLAMFDLDDPALRRWGGLAGERPRTTD